MCSHVLILLLLHILASAAKVVSSAREAKLLAKILTSAEQKLSFSALAKAPLAPRLLVYRPLSY
jgi:hypothetical protein